MAMFKDLDKTNFKPVDTTDMINEREMNNFNQGRYQKDIENLKDEINILTDKLNGNDPWDQSILEPETLDYLGIAEKDNTIQQDKINALIELSREELNKQQMKYDYMLSTTGSPIMRTIRHDVAQVLHDVVNMTDEGDVASFNRIASMMISMSHGATSTHTFKQALVYEGAVSGGETIADVMRMKADGDPITPQNVLGHYGMNLGMGLAMYGLGKGFKKGMDYVRTQAEVKATKMFDDYAKSGGVKYDDGVYEAINDAMGIPKYAEQTMQVRMQVTNAKFSYTEDAFFTGGKFDDAMLTPSHRTVAVIDPNNNVIKKVVPNEKAFGNNTTMTIEEMKVAKVSIDAELGKFLDEDSMKRYNYTKVISPTKPLREEDIISIARAMQKDPKVVLSMDNTLLDAVGSNYTMRNINKKRIQWLLEGRPDLASQPTPKILEEIRVNSMISDYEVLSPQFREVINSIRSKKYSGITEVGQVGINEANIENLSYDIVKALDTHYKVSFKEMNKMIGEIGGAHNVNNMLDLLEYGDKNNLNLVHMMYDPRNASEPWLRELMGNLHNQISTYRRTSGQLALEFELDSTVVKTLEKYNLADELLIDSPFINELATTRRMSNTQVDPERLGALNRKIKNAVERKFGGLYAKGLLDIPHTETYTKFYTFAKENKMTGTQLADMSNRKFKKWLQGVVGVGAKDQKPILDFHAQMRRLRGADLKELNETFKTIGRDITVAKSQLERLPRFMSKETLMGEGYELLGATSDDLTRKVSRVPWENLTEIQRQGFKDTIKPDMDATFKPYSIEADQWSKELKVRGGKAMDTTESTVEDLWKAHLELRDNLDRTANFLFEHKQTKMGEILQKRYGDIGDQEMFDLYAKKYDLPHLKVDYIDDIKGGSVAHVTSIGGQPVQFTINKAHFDSIPRARQLAIIRHEIEHVIDRTKYGVSAPLRGNTPSVRGNQSLKGSVAEVRRNQFEYDVSRARTRDVQAIDEWTKRHYNNVINNETNLDELLTYYYDGHFYNYGTDSFEPSYLKHNKDYMEHMMKSDERYYDFLEATRTSTEYNGREINMNELMHQFFDTKAGFEDFMLTHGGGRGVASGNIMNTVKGDAEIRALNMTRNQYLSSMTKENLLKLQKGGQIGHMDATGGVGRGIKLDADMVHMYSQLAENLRTNWKNDRLTKFAGERFISKNMFSSVVTNMILGNGGIKQTVVAPYQMIERLMMGGKVTEGMKEMFKQVGYTIPNYTKLNAYNFGNMLESFHIMHGQTDTEGVFMMNIARKMQKFGNVLPEGVEGVDDLFLARQMMHEMFDNVSGTVPENAKVKAMHKVFSRQLSTQEFYDTSANYRAKQWVLDDLKEIANAEDYTKLTELQQRILGKGGYLEQNWKEGKAKLGEYLHKDGFDFELATANERDIANMFNTGVGYYNRTDVARKMTKVSAKASDFRYLMRTTIGLGVDSWREINTLVKGGVLMPVNTLSKDGGSKMLQRVGLMGVSSSGALFSYKGIRSMERALKERRLNALRWDREIREMEFNLGTLGNSALTLFEMTGMGIYLADPRSLTIVGASANTVKGAYARDGMETIDNVFKLGFSAVIGSTMMSRYAMLTGSDKEKEAKMRDWWDSGQAYKDIRGNYNKSGMGFTKRYIQNYNNSTKVMESFGK